MKASTRRNVKADTHAAHTNSLYLVSLRNILCRNAVIYQHVVLVGAHGTFGAA